MKRCRANETSLQLLLSFSIFLVSGCYSKFIISDSGNGTYTEIISRFNYKKNTIHKRYKTWTISGKLVEKGKVSILQGTWPVVQDDYFIKYDTVSGNWMEKCTHRIKNRMNK